MEKTRPNFFARAWQRLAKSVGNVSTTFTPQDHAMVRYAFADGATASGKAVTDDTAMRVSAAWACIRVIAETFGAVPWAVYRKDAKGNAEKDDTHPLAPLLDSPNADMSGTEFRESIALALCQRGNAYHFIDRVGGRISALTPIQPSLVKPLRKQGSNTSLNLAEGEVFFRVNNGGQITDFPREKIWHVRGFGSGALLEGLSPIGCAREALGAALAAEEFGSRFFMQGGMPSGVVTVPNWLTQDQRDVARENLTQMLGGLQNAHRFALFEGGMKPEPWGGMPMEDMQFILVRQFSVQEICRFYRVPPHMAADLMKTNFSSVEQLEQEFVMFTLMPYFTRLESSVSKWLLAPEERGKVFLRFNFEGLLRADSAGRASFYTSALQNGWMSRNEVRAKENLNAVPGLDIYTAQLNLAPVDQLGQRAANPGGTPELPGQAPSAQPVLPAEATEKSTSINVVLPESIRYEVAAGEVKEVVSALVEHLKVFSQRLDEGQKTIASEVRAGQRSLAVRVGEGNEQLVEQLVEGNKALAAELRAGQRSLAVRVGEGNEQLVEQFVEGNKALAASIVFAHEAVVEGHADLARALEAMAKQKRRIKVGDEVFVSEPDNA